MVNASRYPIPWPGTDTKRPTSGWPPPISTVR